MVTLTIFILVSALELTLWHKSYWVWRDMLAVLLGVALAASTIGLVVVAPNIWTALIAFLSVYRGVNLARIVKARTQPDYLFFASRKTSRLLIASQAFLLIALAIHSYIGLSSWSYMYVFSMVCFAAVTYMFLHTRHQTIKSRPIALEQSYATRDLPSLTVAIPARNETSDLEACLQSLLASNYPKLEILVLDDCSQNKRTSEIIRSFAHDGVRFVAGNAPPERWLAKNYAYKQLVEQSSGELLLFCGVDTRFGPQSLRNLVELLLVRKKSMVSVLPKNELPSSLKLASLLVQPSRYAWELCLPRRFFERPPVLSTCWLITKRALKQAGGFDAVSHTVLPERYLAKSSATNNDGYSFIISDATLGVSSNKQFDEQRATAERVRYPSLHRRPELVTLVTFLELLLFIGPYKMVVIALISSNWLLLFINLFTIIQLALLFKLLVEVTYRRVLWRSLWQLPLAAVYDIGLLHLSMYRYEFGEVLWKGRNVCLPVMHVIPRFPNLPK